MAESLKFSPAEAANGSFSERAGAFLAAFTGIEQSQVAHMSDAQRKKVFLGLHKQLDLAVSLHGDETKVTLQNSLGAFFNGGGGDIDALAAEVNSLLVFGDIRDLQGTGVEHLHGRLSHFWRILGWEELREIGVAGEHMKYPVGSIESVVKSCGNLIRTLDLISERWDEFGIGPHLVFPEGNGRISRESNLGFHASRIQDSRSSTTVVITGRNEVFPTQESGADFKEKGLLLERLLERYPAEFAYVLFDYYVFAKGQEGKAYNVSIIQEYIKDGKRYVKAVHNGKSIILYGGGENGLVQYGVLSVSNNDVALGSSTSSRFTISEKEVSDTDTTVVAHGPVAQAIIGYPDVVDTFAHDAFSDPRKKVIQFAHAIGKAKLQKPIVAHKLGKAKEYVPTEISGEDVQCAGSKIAEHLTNLGVRGVVVEAGHIHADTTPTKRQKKGMQIGSHLSNTLEASGISVKRSTMIDEDHVPNTLDHGEYIALMYERGFNIDEVLYESSPVVREIAIAAIASLAKKYPENFHREGDTILFDIPGTSLEVELIKDVTQVPFELGCVIFDVGLTLYKVYPELGNLYSEEPGKDVHEKMFDKYQKYGSLVERFTEVSLAFPPKTTKAEQLSHIEGLPAIPDKPQAIVNVLEGFYNAQQVKLQEMLQSLGVPIEVIGVSFSEKGLNLAFPEEL